MHSGRILGVVQYYDYIILFPRRRERLTMSIERMTVAFPEPMASEIRAAVATGEYASTSEAVRDAVRLWTDRREWRTREREMLRCAWDDGKSGGDTRAYDIKKLIGEAKSERKQNVRPPKRG